jgi:hypothetical protein
VASRLVWQSGMALGPSPTNYLAVLNYPRHYQLKPTPPAPKFPNGVETLGPEKMKPP